MDRQVNTPAARRGFSMVESLVAMSLVSIAGAALLTSLSAAVQAGTHAQRVAVARGLADQLMEEIAAVRFPTSSSAATATSASAARSREGFDDIDDYAGWRTPPDSGPTSKNGARLGDEGFGNEAGGLSVDAPNRWPELQADQEFLRRFSREVTVERIEPAVAGGWQVVPGPTDFRRVTVRVSWRDGTKNQIPLVEITRVFSYVPSLQ